MKNRLIAVLLAAGAALGAWGETWTDSAGYTWTFHVVFDECSGGWDSVELGEKTFWRIIPCVSPAPTNTVIIPHIIPIYGLPVTSIGDYAFWNCDSLTSVTIPNSVINIGNSAFASCEGLTSVTIPNSVTSIGDCAFASCAGLTSITIPNSVTSIGNSAFSNCEGLTSVTIPNSVTNIGNGVFSGCSRLMSIYVEPGNPNYISTNGLLLSKDGRMLVQGVNGDVVIPDSVTSIASSAFEGYDGLASVVIPSSVTNIGAYAFNGCSGLPSVAIPNSVMCIGECAFMCCGGLTSMTIPNSVTNIGNGVFSGCSRLMSISVEPGNPNYSSANGLLLSKNGTELIQGVNGDVVIPDSVTRIGSSAFGFRFVVEFEGLTGLTSVTIPNSVTNIGEGAFGGCSGLISISVESGNPNYSSANGLLLSKDGTKLVQGVNGDVVIPDSVTCIDSSAFVGREGLTSVAIPNGVTNIGSSAFAGCSGLTRVEIPNSVTNVGEGAFYGCSGLTSVTIPNSVTSIGDNVFAWCEDLTSVTIPISVTDIGYQAFVGCYALTNVVFSNNSIIIGTGAFAGCPSLKSMTLPQYLCDGIETWVKVFGGGVSDDYFWDELERYCYLGQGEWMFFYHYIFVDGWGIPTTEEWLDVKFKCPSLDSVTILDGVTYINNEIFQGWYHLKNVTIPDSLVMMAGDTFLDCWGLLSISVGPRNPNYSSANGLLLSKDGTTLIKGVNGDVVIPDGVTSIGHGAFNRYYGLTNVMIPDSVTFIGDYAFAGCNGLTSVVIPNSVENIGTDAFSDCMNLANVTIPSSGGVPLMFSCPWQSVTNIVINEGVTLIPDWFFTSYSNVRSITIPSSVTRLGDDVFRDCASLKNVVFLGDAPDVGEDVFLGTPRSLVVSVPPDSIGWNGGVSTGLPSDWNGRGIVYSDASGGSGSGGESGGGGTGGGTVVVTNDSSYALTNSVADRAIASVMVDGDCAIDEFVLKDGKVYDCVLRIVNIAAQEVTLSLPEGYEYESFKGAKPLTIPANSRNIITITRTADRTFLVSREELEAVR